MAKLNNIVNYFGKLKNLTTYEIVLFILLIVYLVSGVSTPYYLSQHINNSFTYLSLIVIVVLIFLYSNPILAILFGIVALVFINRSKQTSPETIKPSQKNKNKTLNNLNQNLNKKTLEEDIVKEMVEKPMNILGPEQYHPVTCDNHNAGLI
tara:strand:+ start:590 stop:1042 length:453 start_codon:yes stop_codon:yes gene_type:complete